ncbi:carboxy-S-adenosyl-L-methionine synthase CmoA [Aestuariibacter sp. GS-14]|uniref:carboxy-S-adenosyl-L-methionine synthase CmoA n=1 Tax=Aestuariibacter sp. GS-14 TaxID=2590670 RepID=UPI00112A842B|nr:carboxy-S-adenosyl-L-methionine synthase CmoA [Aestuariibacter sp. GS-14]TPV59875.1 carboxy-S-adenosyl-L-methionine synthase CmoA [Aestuariibacter sp. GS-14]
MANKDNIFATPREHVGDFCFDDAVADVFPDMINRSVPGYQTIIETIGELAEAYVTPHSNVYDLGCSLGAASLSVARHCPPNQCQIQAIDSSAAMVKRCQRVVEAFNLPNKIHVCEGFAQTAQIHYASMVIMNFTLQFIAPEERSAVIKDIYDGLNTGGIFVLSEKVQHEQSAGNALINNLHLNFKRKNGYSELEISQKRAALENVMLIDSFSTHERRLRDIGFSDVVMWYKCYNFMSLVAIK